MLYIPQEISSDSQFISQTTEQTFVFDKEKRKTKQKINL